MITPAEIDKLASLSRIKLTAEDRESLVKEFDSILGYIDQLKKVEVSLDAEGRVGAVRNVARPDVAEQSTPAEREALLDAAPHRKGDFVAVKKVIAED